MSNRIKESHKSTRCKQIVLVLGLLGGCAWSQLTFAEGQWIADQKGCKVWNVSPQSKSGGLSIIWSGDCINGYANGKGVFQWYNSGIAKGRYEGNFVNGKMNGKGIYLSVTDGTRYEGNFVDGKLSGYGKFEMTSNGEHGYYDGNFLDGAMSGKGVLRYPDGRRYEGNFVEGKFSGKGVFTYPSGTRYEGDFINGNGEGECKYTWSSGSQFNGVCKDIKPYNGIAKTSQGDIQYINGIEQKDSSAQLSSSMGASFLTGLLKTAVGVAVARQTGNNALGAQVALASPEELNGLTNQVALEARQHSDAEIRKKQEIRDQQARQLQEQQAAMQRAQQQSSYGTVGSSNSSSSGSYGTISSGNSSNNYGNSSSTISSGQNNSSSNSNNKPKTERINVPSQSGCVNFAWDKQDGNIQWFKFTNGCAYPVHLTFWETTGSYGAMTLRGGQSDRAWLSRDRSKIAGYKACGLKNGKYDINYDRATNQCWSYADFR